RVGRPELRPAVALILGLPRRPVGEDDSLAAADPVWRAAIGAADGIRRPGGKLYPRDTPARAEGVRHAQEPLAIRRPGRLLEESATRKRANNRSCLKINDLDSFDREARQLTPIGAPARPGKLAGTAQCDRARPVTGGDHEFPLGAVMVAVDQ